MNRNFLNKQLHVHDSFHKTLARLSRKDPSVDMKVVLAVYEHILDTLDRELNEKKKV